MNWWRLLFYLTFLCVCFYVLFPVMLLRLRIPRIAIDPKKATQYQLYMLVPMHNEAQVASVSLAHFLERYAHQDGQCQVRWIVIEDGSTDTTQAQVQAFERRFPNLTVIYRRRDAATGKGAALNAGLAYIHQKIKANQTAQTIVGVLDADGYLAPQAFTTVLNIFAGNPQLDMLQTAVAMRNTHAWLARVQDFEFQVGNTLIQNWRNHMGNAAGSGNGQFFRLSSFAQKAPWGEALLEDFEISTRALLRGQHTLYVSQIKVYQEATVTMGTYLRQRTRWALGGLQCRAALQKKVHQSTHLNFWAKAEMRLFMAAPYVTLILGLINLLALGFQLYYLIALGGSLSKILMMFWLAGLLLSFVLVRIYQRLTACDWQTVLLVLISLPIYTLFAFPVSISALYRYSKQEVAWDKTSHGLF